MDTVHECDRQTDRRTDRQTDRITITDTVQRRASHGKNSKLVTYHLCLAIGLYDTRYKCSVMFKLSILSYCYQSVSFALI